MEYRYLKTGHTHIHRVNDGTETIRILCHPTQFEFIKNHYGVIPMESCSTSVVSSPDVTDVDSILHQMSSVDLPPDLGGFRPVSEAEANALYMGSLDLDDPDGRVFASVCIEVHPFIRAGGGRLNGGFIAPDLIRLLSWMYDIRRFPAKREEMAAVFKLHDDSLMKNIILGNTLPPGAAEPALALKAWLSIIREPAAIRGHSYLFKERLQFIEITRTAKLAVVSKYFRESTQRFLFFIQDLWLSKVSSNAGFDPKTFFGQEDQAKWFNSYFEFSQTVPKHIVLPNWAA